MNENWFSPKRFGYGAGLPISWQGWAVTLGFLAVTAATVTWVAPRYPAAAAIVLVGAGAALAILAAHHTRGGWRWRWGDRD